MSNLQIKYTFLGDENNIKSNNNFAKLKYLILSLSFNIIAK